MEKRFLRFILVLGLLPVFLAAASRHTEADRIRNAIQVLQEVSAIPEKTIPNYLFKRAEGVIIIPGVIKGALILGGHRGKGVMVVRTPGRWSDPTFVTLTGASVGWQVGVESTDLVLIFRTKRSIKRVARGKIILGLNASVAAGPVGRSAVADTDVQLQAEIFSYARGRGVFVGVCLQGAALRIDKKGNRRFYKSDISVEAIFAGLVKDPPSTVVQLRQTLKALSQEK